MNTLYRTILIIILGFSAVFLAACQDAISNSNVGSTVTISTEDIPQESPAAGMENPAAAYCEGLGYTLETVMRNGGEDGDCIFPNGNRCGQWDFLSGRCGQENTYCSQQGGELQDNGTNIASCNFQDGSSCNEYSFFLGECQQGDE